MRHLILGLLLLSQALAVEAAPRQLDSSRWDGVGRIVAIGDLHGDYRSYLTVLRAAGLINSAGHWTGRDTHLVQTGDIPDRGPDTRRIITHLAKLAREAEKRGGRVHHLLGNHEAMNVYGDLRYVVAGEYAAYAGKRSPALRDRHFDAVMDQLKRSDPARHAALPADFRAQWDSQHPLGWVEHRMAWDPRWDPEGDMFRWAMQARVAIQLNDLIFVHGGISSAYCGNSLESMNRMAREALAGGDPRTPGILEDPRGPLWYRGLAGVAPLARTETVDAILRQHGARHIVIGHTPTGGVVWPRLDGRVVMIDTGMGAAYGGHIGWLEVNAKGLHAGYRGGSLPLPLDDAARLAYLDALIKLQPGDSELIQRRDALRAGQADVALVADGAGSESVVSGSGSGPDPAPICGTSP